MNAKSLTDAAGRVFVLDRPLKRIVSLVPSATETLFALGAGDRVVGVTKFCERPRTMPAGVERVGGTKNPNVERIAELEPDLVLVNTEENRTGDIERLREVVPVFEEFPRTVTDGIQMIRNLGALTGAEAIAGNLARAVEAELAMIARIRSESGRRRRVAYFIWKKPWMSVGGDTFIHDVLSLAGLENVFGDRERYPTTDFEELARLGPDVILLSSEPYPFKLEHRNEFLEHEEIPAARMGRIYLVDGAHFCWHGARQLEGLRWIRNRLLE